ncbi:hypothetical protein FS837_010761 [Tulasnella sp. UAMH 9824]|nr:hypothetical protein FS837_010761 [Tulasnella sp. UAMH 9824]
MTQIVTLVVGVTMTSTLALLLSFLNRDTAPHPPGLRITRHASGGVEPVRYGEHIRALQEEEEAGLLAQEPLRGYRRLWNIMLDHIVSRIADRPTPAGGRVLGPQDPTSAVPAPAAP